MQSLSVDILITRQFRLALLRTALAIVLIFAGVLKLLSGIGVGVNEPSIGALAPIWYGISGCEIIFAIWLLTGAWPTVAWCALLACFSGFFAFAAIAAMEKVPSCGCFGPVHVMPRYTAALDLAVIFALLTTRPLNFAGRRLTCGAIVLVGFLIGRVMSGYIAGSDPSGSHGNNAQGAVTILEPSKWVGTVPRVMREITFSARLGAGQWMAAFYHDNCSTCRAAIPGLEKLADGGGGVAFIEMPPYAAPGERLVQPSPNWLVGRLRDDRQWFAPTPVVLLLQDGIVRDEIDGEAAVGVHIDWQRMRLIPAKEAQADPPLAQAAPQEEVRR